MGHRHLRNTFPNFFYVGFILLVVHSFFPVVKATVPLSDFFPFGTDQGDTTFNKTRCGRVDDGFTKIILKSYFGFPLFNTTYRQLWVNNNGGLSFKRSVWKYTPTCGALEQNSTMITPFWADINIMNGGDIFFRESSNRSLLSKAVKDIQIAFPGLWNRRWGSLFIATWSDVSFYGHTKPRVCNDPRNTFQVVLTTDGTFSFVTFLYNKLQWTTGMDAGNDCGLGGTPAKAGFDVGDGSTFYGLPGSCSSDILKAVNGSNVNSPGKWIFRVDRTLESPRKF